MRRFITHAPQSPPRQHSSVTAKAAQQSSRDKEEAVTKDYLSEWAEQAGVVFPKLTQAFFGELRGGKALAGIEPDEVFVTVPRAAALVVAPNERCPCPEFVDAGALCRARIDSGAAVKLHHPGLLLLAAFPFMHQLPRPVSPQRCTRRPLGL
jgi:hypothetical protein